MKPYNKLLLHGVQLHVHRLEVCSWALPNGLPQLRSRGAQEDVHLTGLVAPLPKSKWIQMDRPSGSAI